MDENGEYTLNQLNDWLLLPLQHLIEGFINEVQALIAGGVLTVTQGQPLIDGAQASIASQWSAGRSHPDRAIALSRALTEAAQCPPHLDLRRSRRRAACRLRRERRGH